MIEINKKNLNKVLDDFYNLHDANITNINYNINKTNIEIFIDLYWTKDIKIGDGKRSNQIMKIIFEGIELINIKELFNWDYIYNIYIKYITIRNKEFICFADAEEDPNVYIVCENIMYELLEGKKVKKMNFINYPKCSTCKKAKKWLLDNNIEFIDCDINVDTPTKEELKKYIEISGYPIKKFFNTSGNLYKEFKLKDKLETMSMNEKLTLLSNHGMLIKRPILVADDFVLVGFKEEEWKEKILNKKEI